MQNIAIKVLLNNSICTALPVLPERGFSRVPATYLQQPDYRPEFFETLPTMWATAYIFQRAVEREDAELVEEWVSLLLLHSFGELNVKSFSKTKLKDEYDRDLWPALNGTYPNRRNDVLGGVRLLVRASGVVVGACYPGVIFFPGRDRAEWKEDENLRPYLDDDGQHLSWARCRDLLLPGMKERSGFHRRIQSIAGRLEGELRTALLNFCNRESCFKGIQLTDPLENLDGDLSRWIVLGQVDHKDKEKTRQHFLGSYPYKQTRDGVTTYYLLAGLPVSADWMSRPISPGLPAPNQYEKTDSRIRVRFGEGYEFNLRGDEKIEMLSELFLNVSPYYCALDKTTAEKHSSQIRFLHRQEIVNNTGPFFSDLKTNDLAVCLAPIKSGFLKHFPEAMTEPENYVAMRGRTPDGGLEWEFTLFGQKLVVPTEPKFSKAIIDSKLAIWPPKVSAQWHLYVAHGTGAGGRWLLVDENGEPGDNVELAADEYINILNKAGKPNRPLAIVLRDSSGNERGTLFLARLEEQQTAGLTASLAMDFGTSNTSLAFTVPGNVPSPMLFTLSPKMLWGAEPRLENPGFVPFDWGGRKGYFPSILLKRQMAGFEGVKPETLEARHLFAVDIPGLHANMESRVFDGTLHQTWPEIHKNLKWEHDPQHPWRRPAFLGLALLYAHAELFFRREATVRNYVFTFPLAFSEREQRGFREETAKVISRIRQLCFGDLSPTDLQMVDESTAIANSVGAEGGGSLLETFIDIGGGTTDLAIRHRNLYLLKDSVKVAGKSFFSFSEQNFHPAAKDHVNGSRNFKEHIGKLLLENPSAEFVEGTVAAVRNRNLDLGTFYSLCINRLDDEEFRKKENSILEQRMGKDSYQRYRTELFFDHVIAYALLQACALVAERKLSLASGVKLILSGNGWGLMVFGEMARDGKDFKKRCQQILEDIIRQIQSGYQTRPETEETKKELECLERLKVFDVVLLNQSNLSEAKTAVAIGALAKVDEDGKQNDDEVTAPCLGLTLPAVSFNGGPNVELRWCDRWQAEFIKKKAGLRYNDSLDHLQIEEPENSESPLDHTLTVFSLLGGRRGTLPPEEWLNLNNRLCKGKAYLDDNRLGLAPINYFLSKLLYPDPEEGRDIYLNKLAEISGTLK